MNKMVGLLSTVALSTMLMCAVPVSAEESKLVEPIDVSLETAKTGDGAFSVVVDPEGKQIVARSIASKNALVAKDTPKLTDVYDELSKKSIKAVTLDWVIDPLAGGSSDKSNTFISTPQTKKSLTNMYAYLSETFKNSDQAYLDIQTVLVYSSSKDIMPEYIFVGYRTLDDKGNPSKMTSYDTKDPLVGDTYAGGSEYQYVAVNNSETDVSYHYGKAMPSKKVKHDGFVQTFEPMEYFGETEDDVINNEVFENKAEQNLPPGSSPVFLDDDADGVNGLRIGTAIANGENTGFASGKLMMVLMPIMLMGAVLLIAMGS